MPGHSIGALRLREHGPRSRSLVLSPQPPGIGTLLSGIGPLYGSPLAATRISSFAIATVNVPSTNRPIFASRRAVRKDRVHVARRRGHNPERQGRQLGACPSRRQSRGTGRCGATWASGSSAATAHGPTNSPVRWQSSLTIDPPGGRRPKKSGAIITPSAHAGTTLVPCICCATGVRPNGGWW